MKKVILALALILTASISLISCRETKESETIVREVEVDNDDDDGGILERAGKAVDNEVNEEIDEEINEIGDDN